MKGIMARVREKNISIRVLFPLVFSVSVTVCIVALILFFSHWISGWISGNVRSDMEHQAESISYSVEREIYRMTDLLNETYYQSMKGYDYQSETFGQIMNLVYQHEKDKVSRIDLYDEEGRCIWGSSKTEVVNVTETDWFQDTITHIEAAHFGSYCLQNSDSGVIRVIPVSRSVELTTGGESYEGVLVFYFPVQDLDAALESYGSTAKEYCYLLDGEDEILYHPYQKKLECGISEEWSYEYLDSGNSYMNIRNRQGVWMLGTHKIGYTGWKLVMVSSLSSVQKENMKIYQLIFSFLCLAGILMLGVDVILIQKITKPVSRLHQAIQSFGVGKLDVRVDETGIGEISSLEQGFNQMAGEIQELMDRSITQEQEKRHMERRLLQAQISPHFLYNTLDSIIWMIQGKQYEGAGKMVSLLARFFRVALSKGKDIIPLRQEVEHATSYLSIQNIRFQDKFDFELNIDESLMEYLCPKITIQPILENAIYHGVENMFGDGEIILSIQEHGEDICIEVSDNGEGMTEEQVEKILHHDIRKTSGKGSGVGVYNVDSRIKLLYGENYGISIQSELDEGTTVKILLPKVSEYVAE